MLPKNTPKTLNLRQMIEEQNNNKVQDELGNSTKPLLPAVLDYFGTDLTSAGHYFWILQKERLLKSKVWFRDLPFSLEDIVPPYTGKGLITYLEIDGYYICGISGSCKDNRSGTKSVFWTKEKIDFKDFKNIILSIPIGKQIIEQMPFEVHW